MNIKIDLVISANPELLTVLQTLIGKAAAPIIALPENGEVKKTRTKKTETITHAEEVKSEEPVKEELRIIKGVVASHLTQEIIIADAVPKSKAGHKDKIKAKVTELGYESITDLQPEHFEEFWSFLQTIPKPA